MSVANVALKLQYPEALKIWQPEGTKQMSMVYKQTMHHLCMSGKESTIHRKICVDFSFLVRYVNHHHLFQ